MSALAWLAWALAAWAIVWPLLRWLREEREILAPLPIALATLGFYLLPRAAYLLAFGRPPLTAGALPPQQQTALIAQSLLLSALAALAFTWAHRSSRAATWGASIRFDLPTPDGQRAALIAAVAGILGLAASAYLLRRAGGIAYAFAHQFELGQILQGQSAAFQFVRLLLVPVALLLVDERRRRTRPVIWAFALLGLLAVLPFGRRSFIASALAYPVLITHLCVRRIPLRTMVASASVAAALLFGYSYLRLFGPEDIKRAGGVFARHPAQAVHFAFNASGELRIFDALTIVVHNVPDDLPHSYGASFARVPWMVIPRTFWPTHKPVTLGEEITRRYVPRIRAGYPPTAIGEFYVAAGVGAVLLGFAAMGFLSRAAWAWFGRRRGSVGAASLYITLCYLVYDFTRVGDPSRTFWFAAVTATGFIVAFCVADARLSAAGRRT